MPDQSSRKHKKIKLRNVYVGEQFGSLTVDGKTDLVRVRSMVWCICKCGKRIQVSLGGLVYGYSKSCGCTRRDKLIARNTTHGLCSGGERPSEYNCWAQMLDRCRNSKLPGWNDYGGRGIKVCKRWHKFENFLTDMGFRPSKEYSIDRIDNDGNYEPGNCRWATDKEQANNTRRNRRLTYDGITLTLREWAKRIGITDSSLHGRLRRMSVERALSMPPQENNYKRKLRV